MWKQTYKSNIVSTGGFSELHFPQPEIIYIIFASLSITFTSDTGLYQNMKTYEHMWKADINMHVFDITKHTISWVHDGGMLGKNNLKRTSFGINSLVICLVHKNSI